MSLIGNIIWFIFGGLLTGLGYILGGLILCVTIIGIPWGIKAIQFGFTVMTPFGKRTQHKGGGEGCLPMAMNIIWLLLFGWEIALAHLIFGVIFAVTIIGIPFAKQHFKLVPIALLPFTYELR
ncbi:MAG: YccF domain-containing protein [Anaerolineae bacterium]